MTDRQIEVLVKWMERARVKDDPDLDILFALDGTFSDAYNLNRISKGFQVAARIGNEAVIREILKRII